MFIRVTRGRNSYWKTRGRYFKYLNTTVSRTARFSGYKTQSKERPKSTIMNISEKQNKLGDYVKAKLMGNDLKLIKESENELKRAKHVQQLHYDLNFKLNLLSFY